jgi:hypothetical protein
MLVCGEVAGVRVEEAVGRAWGVFEDLESFVGGMDEGEEAGESRGAVVRDVDGFETRGGAGD